MSAYVALLRAVNVGGTGKLAMSELRALCENEKFSAVSTYIQSGNVVFKSPLSALRVSERLEAALLKHMGKPIDVLVRTAAELSAIARNCPFSDAAPNQVLVLFLTRKVSATELKGVTIPGREKICAGAREVYVHYPDGMGRSKLKLPLTGHGTARNMNTVNKLVAMLNSLSD